MAKEPKKPGGIALRPSLWKRIDALAEERGVSRNEVMETCLAANLPAPANSYNVQGNSIQTGTLDDSDFHAA